MAGPTACTDAARIVGGVGYGRAPATGKTRSLKVAVRALERDQGDKAVVAAIAVELHLHIVTAEQKAQETIGEGIR